MTACEHFSRREPTWQTSVFPDKKRGAFLLPVKAAVRKAEHLIIGDRPLVTLIVCHAIGG
ncbi:DUF1905 domain-containing protein [Humisphaera borealis]|uniref:DUF1905 domain-containing protein n=1 Tax=Humisphaera borealis TaxID=2807512 RepID=A0A7M2X4J8_9BACT|nr:DUF1905 domain-containing protein [Humisphaera borealis]